METTICVKELGKRYRIGRRESYKTLRDTLMQAVSFPRRAIAKENCSDNWVWALKDASFDVQPGQAVGIIGCNGAGKSTLLKILSRITEPTEGSALLHGRVGSLLEVGTGFHPELTGRENIFLNGAILGMRRFEIIRQFDSIIQFSGVEKFLDTPVKHYSTGMYVRLAFSVAAHLQTEILLVDEVLAVGDAAFQLKCLNKMSEVSSSGKTILFVSHNMESVIKLCDRALLMDQGRIVRQGTPQECIDHYLFTEREKTSRDGSAVSLKNHPGRTKHHNGPVSLTSLRIEDSQGQPVGNLSCGRMARFVLGYEIRSTTTLTQEVTFSITFSNLYNHRIATCRSHDAHAESLRLSHSGEIVCRIPRLALAPGFYRISLGCNTDAGFSDGLYDVAVVEVTGTDFYPSGSLPPRSLGEVLFDHSWDVQSPVNIFL